MADAPENEEKKIEMNAANLFREEMFTDLRAGTITRLTPVKADGTDDPMRATQYIVRTQIYTDMGLIPIEAPVEAKSLAEVVAKFPDAVEAAIQELARRYEQRQREASRQIVTPGQMMGGMGGMGGGRGGPGGGLII